MNLRQLYYFKELVEQKQFLKAARNLNISQPSLSNAIKELEKGNENERLPFDEDQG